MGYANSGPQPPNGLTRCDPIVDTYLWCNTTDGSVVPDTISHRDPTPSSDPNATSSVAGIECLTNSGDAPCPNVTFSGIRAINGTAMLHHAPNGNIYSFDSDRCAINNTMKVATCHLFAGSPPFVTGGATGRLLHGYNDTMATRNVSRLRLSRPQAMPNTSLPV